MGMIDRFLSRAGYERRATEDISWKALAPLSGHHAGLSARAAENLSTVLACTSAIATALAYVPARIYTREGENRIENTRHPLNRLVRAGATDSMTWCDTIEHWIADTLLTGNGLIEIERGGNGQVTGLRHHPWGYVTVSELNSGRLAYDVSDGRARSKRLLEGEVLHLRDRTDDGRVGRSRLSRSSSTVESADLANTHARQFLANGASPSGVIEAPHGVGEEALGHLRESFERRHSGTHNAGRAMILSGGMSWKSVSISPEDAELLETRKFGVIELCRLFQVPPPIVQAYENNTFTNASQAGLWFATFCLAPWARKIEAEFARSLFPASSPHDLELDLSGFLRGDPETRWNAHKIALETGVLDPDEVRQIEGWNPRGAQSPEVEV